MNRLHMASALVLAGTLATAGCAVGTKSGGTGHAANSAPPQVALHASSTNTSDAAAPPSAPTTPAPATSTSAETLDGALLMIMDASGSMNKTGANGQPLIDSAKNALHSVVDSLPAGLPTGLRVFGDRYSNAPKAQSCRDSQLIAPVKPVDREALNAAIDSYAARGWTPIGYSLQQAANDLPREGKRTILLVSDGQETCSSNPCQVAATLRGNGVDVVIDTVGMVLGNNAKAREQLRCIARVGGGQFYDVQNVEDLSSTLSEVSSREARRFEPTGQELEGAPIPPQANTGTVGVQYTDSVKSGETNYYHFPVPAGSQVEAHIYVAGNPAASDVYLSSNAYLVDDGDNLYRLSNMGFGDGDENQVLKVAPVTVSAGEVWLKIVVEERQDKGDLFNIQFEVDSAG